MTVQPPSAAAILNAPPGSSAANAASTAQKALSIDPQQFLTLITAQLQNQNPMSPTDPTQFLAQLEGLSQVSSMQNMQSSLSASLQATQVASGTALLGRTILAAGSSANLAAGGTVSGAVSAPAGASSVTLSVTDAAGAPVKSFTVPASSVGLTAFTWDGTTSSGAAAPAGTYSIAAIAGTGSAAQPLAPLLSSTVQSVTIDPTTQILDLNTTNGAVPLSAVVSVR